MFRSGMKQTGLFLVLASIFVFSSCGTESAPTLTSATVGPTVPSGYFFDLTISPSVFEVDGSATITVRVWDSSGPASGVTVSLAGSVEEGGSVTTSTNGIGVTILDVSGSGTGVSSLTATLEDKSVTVSYMIVPEG